MGNTDHDHIMELIPAYALGLLDTEEVETVRQHLATCRSCQGELAAYEAVVDALPLATPEIDPSPALKSRLIERVHVAPTKATLGAAPRPPLSKRISEMLQRLSAAPRWQLAALIIIIALIVSNLLTWQLLSRESSGRSTWRRAVLVGTEAAPDATGIIYISADGRNGTLIVDGLPMLSQEQQYQLWLIEDGRRASGGIFSVGADGYRSLQIESPQLLKDFSAFGITIEPAGGSAEPTGVRVLSHNL